MKALSLHTKVCTLIVCLALMFANVAGAIGMAPVDHAKMELDSSHCMHGSALMDMTATASHHPDHAEHMKMTAMADTDCCMEDSSCIAECAAHCTSGAVTGNQTLIASSLVASYVQPVNHTPQSAVISELYKPPKNLH